MKKVSLLFSAMIIMILALSACASGGQTPTSASGGQATGAPAVTSAAPGATTSVSTPVAAGPTAAPVTPSGMQSLSTLYAFPVNDAKGTALGTVDEFLLDMCNARILGIIMKPDKSLNLQNDVPIPYEAFKLTSTGDAFELNTDTANLTNAPTLDPKALDLTNPGSMIDQVGGYWSKYVQLNQIKDCPATSGAGSTSGATTAAGTMPAPAETSGAAGTPSISALAPTAAGTMESGAAGASTPLATGAAPAGGSTAGQNFKLVLAKSVLFTSLQDQTGTTIGKVNSIIANAATGALVYFIIQPSQPGKKLVAVPAGALTVQNPGASNQSLVLTPTNAIFLNAPAYDIKTDVTKSQWDTQITNYWSSQMGAPQATP